MGRCTTAKKARRFEVIIGDPSYSAAVSVGDLVIDDLTRAVVLITRIEFEENSLAAGVWVDHEYLDGARHPWELTPLPPWRTVGM